ncbi:MAG: AAA family ATPase [Candidatus Nanoarchaeia archaeon]|nr:AAA family ATPase [Candidatus Nanoarchaeia archaeon]MDD5054508.1 AAA family ATPase [Candidatus Nanoarchaeia archaeon]
MGVNEAFKYLIDAASMMNNYKAVISQNYFNSSVVLCYPSVPVNKEVNIKVDFTLDDIIATAALTGSPIAIIGSSGSGKSYLSDIMAHSLFGGDFGEKTINPNVSQMDFVDPAYRKMLEAESKEEYIKPDPLLKKPCIILNELNRTPSILQNFFLAMLEKKVNLYGVNFDVGLKNNNDFYCFIMATLNEGAQYSGVSDVDLALRNRFSVELFIDNYDYNSNGDLTGDLIKMLSTKPNRNLINSQRGYLDTITNIFKSLDSISLDVDSYLFLEYLNWINKCVKSNTESKRSIPPAQLVKLCNGCEYAKDHNDFCRNFYKPSKRAFSSIISFARAITFMKEVKVIDYCAKNNISVDFSNRVPVVTLDDMLIAAPFVLAGKTEMNPKWVGDHYQGNKIYACQDICNFIKSEIIESNEISGLIKSEDNASKARVAAFKKKRLGNDILNFLEEFLEDE